MERRWYRLGVQGLAAVAALTLAACGRPYPNPTPEAPPPPPPAADLAGGPATPSPPPPPVPAYPPPPPPPEAYPAAPPQPAFTAMQPIPNPPETEGEHRRDRHERRREARRAEAQGYAPVQPHQPVPARRPVQPHPAAAAPHPAAPVHPPVVTAKPAPAKPVPVPAKPAPAAAKPAPAAPAKAAPVVKPAAKVEAPKAAPAAKAGAPVLAPPTANAVAAGENAESASPLGDRATRLAALETSLAEAARKSVVLSAPQTFTAGKAEEVTLILPADFADTVKDQAAKNDLADAVASVNITAVLSGDGFAVMPDTAQSQPLTLGQPTSFKWTVTPAEGAKGPLHADVGADLLGGGSDVLSLGSVQAGDGLGFMKSSRMLGIGVLALLAVLVIAWLVRGRGEPTDSIAARHARRERARKPVQLGGKTEL